MPLNPHVCAICAHPTHSPMCRHPWKDPFERWPLALLNQLKRMVPNGYDPDPPPPEKATA